MKKWLKDVAYWVFVILIAKLILHYLIYPMIKN